MDNLNEAIRLELDELVRNRAQIIENFVKAFIAVKLPPEATVQTAKAIFDQYQLVERRVQDGPRYTVVFTMEKRS
jgi:hypothetical protein